VKKSFMSGIPFWGAEGSLYSMLFCRLMNLYFRENIFFMRCFCDCKWDNSIISDL